MINLACSFAFHTVPVSPGYLSLLTNKTVNLQLGCSINNIFAPNSNVLFSCYQCFRVLSAYFTESLFEKYIMQWRGDKVMSLEGITILRVASGQDFNCMQIDIIA